MTTHRKSRLAGMVVVIAITSTLTSCEPGWDKSFFTLEDALTVPGLTTVTNAQDHTSALCEGVNGCIEGWTTDQADFLRFDSNETAREFASSLAPDRYQSNRVVIDFGTTQPSNETRELMIELIDGIHNSE